MTFQRGHRFGPAWLRFPHMCPGFDCAIEEYLYRRLNRARFEALIARERARLAERMADHDAIEPVRDADQFRTESGPDNPQS